MPNRDAQQRSTPPPSVDVMAADRGESTLSALYQAVLDTIDTITEEAVRQIRSRLPAYEAIPLDEHRASTRYQLIVTLDLVAANRADVDPAGDELASARDLGGRRARQGIALVDVIESFHLGSRELFRALVESASSVATPDALRVGGMVWDLVNAGTAAVAVGHNEVTSAHQAVRANQRTRLLELLERGEVTEEAAEIAVALGFDPAGDFQAVCTSTSIWSDVELQRLQHDHELGPAAALSSRRGDVVVTLFQNLPSFRVIESIQRIAGRTPAGTGLLRTGLPGAAMSVTDGRRALSVSQARATPASFEDVWLSALVLEHRNQLDHLLLDGAQVAADNPHLAQAVRAFADHGFSVSAAARSLHLHTNSLAYRIERWQQLTGWDLRTADGFIRSLVCLALP